METKIYYQSEIENHHPQKAHSSDAGFDLFASEEFTVGANSIVVHDTKVRLQMPIGTYAQLAEKSGLAAKGIQILGGVIDSSYRGNIKVVMYNVSSSNIEFKKGQKITQLIMHPFHCNYEMVFADSLSETQRGEGGFGSTGA